MKIQMLIKREKWRKKCRQQHRCKNVGKPQKTILPTTQIFGMPGFLRSRNDNQEWSRTLPFHFLIKKVSKSLKRVQSISFCPTVPTGELSTSQGAKKPTTHAIITNIVVWNLFKRYRYPTNAIFAEINDQDRERDQIGNPYKMEDCSE